MKRCGLGYVVRFFSTLLCVKSPLSDAGSARACMSRPLPGHAFEGRPPSASSRPKPLVRKSPSGPKLPPGKLKVAIEA